MFKSEFDGMKAPVATYRTVYLLAKAGLIEELKDFNPVKESKAITPPMPRLTMGKHRRLMGIAARTLMELIHRGGTKDEIIRAAKYGMIVQDAHKYQIDTYDAYMKLGIDELVKKYNLYSPY